MSRPRRPDPFLNRVPTIVPPTPAEWRAFLPGLTNRRVIRPQVFGVTGGATQLSITTQPSSAPTTGVAFAQQPVIQLRNAGGSPVSLAGVVVTAARASGSDTLGGTLTATTNGSGVATFTNLMFTGTAGANTIVFTAPGLTSVTSNSVTPTSSGFAAPDLLSSDWETGFDGWTNWSGGTPNAGANRSLARTNEASYSGSWSIKTTFQPNGSDAGAQLIRSYGARDFVYFAVHFRANNAPSTAWKWMRFYDSGFNTPFGGFWLTFSEEATRPLKWIWDAENGGSATFLPIDVSEVLDDQWHCAECLYIRNGDASGWPRVRIWYDGTQRSYADGTPVHFQGAGNFSYWSGGDLFAGMRGSSNSLGYMECLATLNGGNNQSGTCYIDKLSFSTQRIGNL